MTDCSEEEAYEALGLAVRTVHEIVPCLPIQTSLLVRADNGGPRAIRPR